MSDYKRSAPALSAPESVSERTCRLCGLPLGRSKITQKIEGVITPFCCPGCARVFSILFQHPGGLAGNFRESALYKACLESGIIARDERASGGEAGEVPETETAPGAFAKELAVDLTLKIGGMWCPACSWLIEEVLRKTKGVLDPQVSFLTDALRVKYLPHVLRPQEIMAKISRLGYVASPFQEESPAGREEGLLPLGISAILTANIMMVSFALYLGFFQEFSPETIGYLSYPLWAMATPVVFWAGLPILKRAFIGLRYGVTSMETLVAFGALAAYSYSLIQLARGSLHVYFDTASMLIALTLLGKYVEAKARGKVSKEIDAIHGLVNPKVRLLQEGKERWVSAGAVQPGDMFLALPGERIPLDGQVIRGEGFVDESFLTGEARPIRKRTGDEVMGGAMLLQGELSLRVTRLGEASTAGQLLALVQKALREKNPFEMLADRITRWFIPSILAVAAATGLGLSFLPIPAEEAFLRSMTVLVIACPCALGIAVPLGKVAAVGRGLSRGIVIRDPGALERVPSLDTLVFDKTGTLTEGNFSLREIVAEGVPVREILARVASLEMRSEHFLAREIVRKAKESSLTPEEAESFEELKGMGVRGTVGGKGVVAGNRQILHDSGIGLPVSWEEKIKCLESRGMTVVLCGWEGRAGGFLVFGDSIRRAARETIRDLSGRGLSLWLVSGDARETTRAIAQELGIRQYRGQALPEDKVELIRALQKEGHRVGMVGDGINDASALAQADVGFAPGTGANLAREASDLTLMGEDTGRLPAVFDLATLTNRIIRRNLFFAFAYNGLAIPLAVSGLLNPLIAVLAMFASSLTVIGNTLRLSKRG